MEILTRINREITEVVEENKKMKEKITQYEENKVEEHFLELIQRYTGEMIQRANRELSINVQEAYAEYLGRQD